MAELLGVLASAAQLAHYTLKISAAILAIHDRVHNAPELRRGATQVQQLLDTAIQIQQNPRVHNSSVLRHLASATDEAKSLLDLLEQLLRDYSHGSLSKRCYKAARGSKHEKKIATGFQNLEQEKTSLLFCISAANTEKLYSIQTGMAELADGMSSSRVAVPNQVQPYIATNPKENLQIVPRAGQNNTQQAHGPGEDTKGSSNVSGQSYPRDAGASPAQPQTSHDRCKVVGENNTAHQHNGHVGDKIIGISKYTDCTVTGKGTQLNGSVTGEAAIEVVKNLFRRGGS